MLTRRRLRPSVRDMTPRIDARCRSPLDRTHRGPNNAGLARITPWRQNAWMDVSCVSIDRSFCGPPASGNGGYTCGLLAQWIDGAAEVTLRAPPPLEHELHLERTETQEVKLRLADGTLIAEGKSADVVLSLPEAVSFEQAERASHSFVGFEDHPYPGCFVCGPKRASDHAPGLALFPGALDGVQRVAAPFRPQAALCDGRGQLKSEFMWAALDCPSWFGHAAFVKPAPKILLGRLAAKILRRPMHDERCVVQGWALGREGRRILCASALFDDDGVCLAYAKATWIELKS